MISSQRYVAVINSLSLLTPSASLRREQRRLKQEDNFDTAAILLGLAKQERAAKEAR